MPFPNGVTCKSCRYGIYREAPPRDPDTTHQRGGGITCRRFPEFIDRGASDWCGEFKEKTR